MFNSLRRLFKKRFSRFYQQKRWRLILDISLIAVILFLAVAVLSLHFYNPKINDFNSWVKPDKKEESEKITEPPVEIDFVWESKIIYPNKTASLTATIKNTADVAVTDYKLIFSSRDSNFAVSGELILPDLAANSERAFPLDITILSQAETPEKLVSIKAEQSYQIKNQSFKESYDLPTIKLISTLTVSGATYYNSPQGDQLGSGPLPPVVGLPTNFWIFLKAEADGDFDDFSLSAKLPKNVELTENSSLLAGDLSYNQAARQIVWRVEKIEAELADYRAGFEVQLIPEEGQIGDLAPLLNQLRYQAKDSFAGAPVEGSLINIDTSLEADALNRGEGKVLPLE